MGNPRLTPAAYRRRTRIQLAHGDNVIMLALMALIAGLVLAGTLIEFRLGAPARLVWFVGGGLSMALILVFRWVNRLDWLASPVAYALVFWMFHFGLVFPASVIPSVLDQFAPWNIDWLYFPEAGKAVLLSALFLAAFFLGWIALNRPNGRRDPVEIPETGAPELVVAGRLVLGGGLLLAALGILQFGVTIFLSSYEVFFQIHNIFSWAVVVTAYGLVLLLAGGLPLRSVLRTMLWSYLPLAVLTFLAGARTAPLFTAAVLGVVMAKRGLRLPNLGLGVVALIMLLSISLVRETRQVGLGEALVDQQLVPATSALTGMTELGGSLRPVAATVHYIEVANNDYLQGQTYVYPVWRQLQRLLGLPRSDPQADPRFIATHISQLYSAAMGYSVVAEGFANGGPLGVLLFALAWGAILGWLDRLSVRPYGLALLAAVLIPMMINIRNSFIFVPAWIFLGVLVLLTSRYLLRNLLVRRAQRYRRRFEVSGRYPRP